MKLYWFLFLWINIVWPAEKAPKQPPVKFPSGEYHLNKKDLPKPQLRREMAIKDIYNYLKNYHFYNEAQKNQTKKEDNEAEKPGLPENWKWEHF